MVMLIYHLTYEKIASLSNVEKGTELRVSTILVRLFNDLFAFKYKTYNTLNCGKNIKILMTNKLFI